jgi:hypothetical protein
MPCKSCLGAFLPQACGHAFQQTVAAVRRTDDGLATFRHLHARFALERDVADHLALAVPRHGRNEFAALDLVPVAAGREHFGVDVVVAVDFEEAAGDRRRIGFLRQVDDIVARGRRHGGRGHRLLGRGLVGGGGGRRLGVCIQAAVDADLPSIDAVFMAGDAGITADAARKRCHHVGKSRITRQQDAGADLTARAQEFDAGAFAARVRCAQRLPCLHRVVRDQACHRRRHGFGERGLAHEGAHQLAVLGLKHEPKLGKPGDGGRWHVWTCLRPLWRGRAARAKGNTVKPWLLSAVLGFQRCGLGWFSRAAFDDKL